MSGGPSIHQRAWRPEQPSRATVVIVHGFTEHSGRYEHVARALVERGVAVHALDLRGHGQSGGSRASIGSFSEYVDDVVRFVTRVRRENSGKPLFLFGHSMGGTIATLVVVEGRLPVDGLILSAPAFRVGANVFPLLRRVAAWVSRIWPGLRVVRMGSKRLSRDPENVARFRADPLVIHSRFPVRTGAEILSAGQRAHQGAQAVDVPLLVLQGTGDLVVDAEGARSFHARAASRDKTLHLYEGLYHDLAGEPEKDRVVGDLVDWVVSHC